MKKVRNELINKLRYLCLFAVIALGLITILATGDGGGGDGDNSRNEEQVSGTQVLQVMDGLGDIYNDLISQNDEQTALDETANWLRDTPEVAPESVAVSNRAIHFIFIDGTPGIFLGYDILSESEEEENVALKKSSSNSDIEFQTVGASNLFLESENSSECWLVVPACKTSIILDPFISGVYTGKEVEKILNKIGYTAEYVPQDQVTLEKLRSMDSKGVIFFNTHGMPLKAEDIENLKKMGICNCKEDDVVLCTGEEATPENLEKYKSLGNDCKIALMKFSSYYPKKNWLAVTPKFFEDVDLCKSNLFYAHACFSLVNNSMAEALMARGTGAYVGWTRSFTPASVYETPLSFFVDMGLGYTVEFASLHDGSADATFAKIGDCRDLRLLTCDLQGPVLLGEFVLLDPPRVSFHWEAVEGAHHYHIRMGTDLTLIRTEGSDSCTGTDVGQNPGCFERWADLSFWEEDFFEAPAGVYYWAVIPSCNFITVPDIGDCYVRGEWSSVRSFTYP